MLSDLCFYLGLISLFGFFRCVYPFLAVAIFGGANLKKQGKWAVVTGATDGIGLAYCKALAKKGMNVCLVSRTLSKLQDCEKELKKEYKVETKILAADFSKCQDSGFAAPIEKALNDLDIGLLVNNVGMSYDYPLYFAEEGSTPALHSDLVKLNVTSTTVMTKIVLPGMVDRKRGAIINISSVAGHMTCGSPMLSTYSGTKAYVEALTKSIAYEVASKNVIVQAHIPAFVTTKLSKIRKPNLMTPTPDAWVKSSLAMLGVGGPTVVPYFMHFVQDFVSACLPDWVAAKYVLSLHQGIQKRALKKKEREAAEGKKE